MFDISIQKNKLQNHSDWKLKKQNQYRDLLFLAKPETKFTPSVSGFQMNELSVDDLFAEKKRKFDWFVEDSKDEIDGLEGFFLTLTVDGYMHTGWDVDVDYSFVILKQAWKHFRKALSKELGFSSKFVKTFEQHESDLTPHLHAMIFVKPELMGHVFDIWNRVYKYLRSIRSGIGVQVDAERIKKEQNKNPIYYIAKYIAKGLSTDNKRLVDGYFRFYGERQMTYSNVNIPFAYMKTARAFLKSQHGIVGLSVADIHKWAKANVHVEHITHKYCPMKTHKTTSTIIKNNCENPQLRIIKASDQVDSFMINEKPETHRRAIVVFDSLMGVVSDSRDWIVIVARSDEEVTKSAILDYINTKCRQRSLNNSFDEISIQKRDKKNPEQLLRELKLPIFLT